MGPENMQALELSQILAELRNSEQHKTRFNESWTQGRSAFGGLSSSIAACGMEKLLPQPLPMRSLMVSFIAPIPAGDVVVCPRILRQGKNVIQMSADLLVDGAICLQAMGVFGASREALRVEQQVSFDPEPRSENNLGSRSRRLPPFLQYFEGEWTGGGMPYTGTGDNRLGIWASHRCDMSSFTTEKIIALADIPPPVVLSHYREPGVMASSLTWSLEFVSEPSEVTADWFYLDYKVNQAAHGYTQQSGKLFTESGQLCALSRQCMVYFDNAARKQSD